MSPDPEGLVVIDKPAGMTSHDVVGAVRRALGQRRVGHAGTLDPPATGVLLVGVGRATRLLAYLQGSDKSYEGTIALGSTTTTLDATGELTATYDMSAVTDAQVKAAAASLTGEIDQVPPMVSALHVGGRRLHELAREGIVVERDARRVVVRRFDVDALGPGRFSFRVECSAGTYVRVLAEDLGRALGGGAHLESLRRTRSGRFGLDAAVPLARVLELGRATALEPPAAMVAHLDAVVVSAHDAAALRHGRAVRADAPGALAPGEVAVLGPDESLIAVASLDADGTLRPKVVMAAPGVAIGDD